MNCAGDRSPRLPGDFPGRHVALTDFGTRRLRSLKFFASLAYYSTLLLAFNLYEAFKGDVFA